MRKNSKTVIIIVGATASGKTDLSLEAANYYKTDIISADSRQCYKEMNIGVAKPPEQALQSIKHYFINSHSIHDEVNAAVFESYALQAVNEIFTRHDIAVMVGGTGMYIKAFCEGLDTIPYISSTIRNQIIKNYEEHGLNWLQHEIQMRDPLFWQQAEQQNPQRLMRALEVITATGNSITSFRNHIKKSRPFRTLKLGIDLTKQQLHENIDYRIDRMISDGLIGEVSSLKELKHLNALQTVGYKEIFEYLDHKQTQGEAIQNIRKHTKQYAKRQLTWFRKDPDILWEKKLVYKSIL